MSILDFWVNRVSAAVRSAAEVGTLPAAAHRPWPLPEDPWIMMQTWENLLFAHWPLPAATLRPLVPEELHLETFDGSAWLAVTPFVIGELRPRALPAIPGLSRFPEINVRTYVRVGDKPGVFFFSLDAGSQLAVTAARRLYKLPYHPAQFEIEERDGWFHYACRRTGGGTATAECHVSYRSRAPVKEPTPGELDHWLTERYCLYAVDRGRRVYCAEIHHKPWPLQLADAEFRVNTMTAPLGVRLPDIAPLIHFAKQLDVHVWAPHSVEA
ncbi:MAG: hypothetical protein DMD81_20935 [Candidatus Rokuibacteriota bacterium]|nr:MAG: hypothetical protein DMD81_20935 [Candidatus Rokubacteria bacterium]